MSLLRWRQLEFRLLPERAVWWAAERTLFVADVHVGKDEALRAAGLAIPPGHSREDLERLGRVVRERGARRLVVLGDFLHARSSRSPEVHGLLREWRAGLAIADVTLVRGNHDRWAGDPEDALSIRVVEEPHRQGRLWWLHDPDGCREVPAGVLALAGHLHPALRVGRGLRLPTFWLRGRTLILPAFSEFTGGARIRPGPGDRCWVVAESEVIPIHGTTPRRSGKD